MEYPKRGYFFLRHRRRSKLIRSGDFLPLSFCEGIKRRISKTLLHQTFCLLIIYCMVLPTTCVKESPKRKPEFIDTYTDSYQTRVPLDPVFLTKDNNVTVREGGVAELPCSIQHLGTKKVAWRRVDSDTFLSIGQMAFSEDTELQVKHINHNEELDDWNLVLPKVRKQDAGLYECQLTSVGGYHTHVRLNVVGPPITDPDVTLTGTEYVERGGQIKLQCNATGGKQIADQIDWFKDGNIISSPGYKDYVIYNFRWHETGVLVSTLQVDRATQNHAGTYVCRSSYNKLKDIQVTVLVADSVNVKRGTISSNNNNTSSSEPLQRSALCVLFCLVVTQWTITERISGH